MSPEETLKMIHARLEQQGPSPEVLVACLKGHLEWPENIPLQQVFLQLLKEIPPSREYLFPQLIRSMLEQMTKLLPKVVDDLVPYVPWAMTLLQYLPEWHQSLAECSQESIPEAIPEIFSNSLFCIFLQKISLTEPSLEIALTNLRRQLLNESINIPGKWEEVLLLLAQQCWNNEFVFLETPEEKGLLEYLTTPSQDIPLTDQSIINFLVYSCYRDPRQLDMTEEQIKTLKDRTKGWEELIRAAVEEPKLERVMGKQIMAVTPISQDDVCGSFYEQNPYPRWLSLDLSDLDPLYYTLQTSFSHYDWGPHFQSSMEVLIAGCGTGQQLLYHCFSNPDASVTGIDLSMASLGYASRMVSAYDAGHRVKLYQADLMNLDEWDKRFELIECGGVLHHLTNPEKGLGNLLGLLKSGGLLRLGVYSRTARQPVLHLRKKLNIAGNESIDKVRKLRWEILNGRDPAFRYIKMVREFYSLNDCRDLLFHPRERQYDLPDLAEWFETYNLSVLGLELWNPQNYSLYKQAFPDDMTLTNLDNWWQLEQSHPDLFSQMYVIWLKKT